MVWKVIVIIIIFYLMVDINNKLKLFLINLVLVFEK